MHRAELYDSANELQTMDAELLLDDYLPLMFWGDNEEEIVVDVGCGTGSVTADVLQKKIKEYGQKTPFKILGLDISEEMVSFAQKK